jgi:hypothetical protein
VQKGAKKEPKETKREPKGAKGEPKGAKGEPKDDQNASKNQCPIKSGKRARPILIFWSILDPFWELKTFKNHWFYKVFLIFVIFGKVEKTTTVLELILAPIGRFWDPLRNPMGSKIRSGSAEGPSRACQHDFRQSLFLYLALHPTSHHLFFMLSFWVSVSAGTLR